MPYTRKYELRTRNGMRKTRSRKGKGKGGSRRELNLYRSPANMHADMDFFLVSAHGTTTSDDYFFTVPENTYMVFTTPSGTLAPGEFKELDELEVAGANKNAYYQTLYDRMFTPGGSKYPGESFIYEPGDLIPDYNLSFRNNGYFYAKMGVYELPFTNPFPGLKGDYYGRTVTFIKRLLDAGKLTEADVSSLTGEIADHLKTKTAEEIEQVSYYKDLFSQISAPYLIFWEEHEKKIMNAINESDRWNKTPLNRNPVEYKDLPLRSKLDQFSTFTDDNLIKDLLLPSKKYGLRLSTVLNTVKPNPAKKRFFFMSFCRVSYEDILSKYDEKRSKPKLLRALSFSQKCSVGNEDKVINCKKLVDAFASYPLEKRRQFIELPAGQRFTFLLKKIIKADWKSYMDGTYNNLHVYDQMDMRSPYVGYIKPEELNELTNLHRDLTAFPEIAKPLEYLDTQIDKYDESLQKVAEEKKDVIAKIYDIIYQHTGHGKVMRKVKGKEVWRVQDFLFLQNVDIDKLKMFLDEFKNPKFVALMQKNTGKGVKANGNGNRNNNSVNSFGNDTQEQEMIKFVYHEFTGSDAPHSLNYNSFTNSGAENEDTSIELYNGSNNENNSVNGQNKAANGNSNGNNDNNNNNNNNHNNSNSTQTATFGVVSNSNTNGNALSVKKLASA
jgi:hypothetical protein